jgi:2-polyprenyl-6-methoxyphenol hydroxylase-like FAD-dependent oxidoreductase
VEIVIAGGGIVGLSSAMLLARDGHEVVVIERDPAPPADPTAAWDDWEHRGVTQVRMAHHFAPRFRALVERELPDVLDGLVSAGAHRYNPLDHLPAGVRCAPLPGDTAFDTVTARRVVVESVVDAAASATPGLRIRRGEPVAGLVAGAPEPSGIPSVTGVRLASGEELACDLVVDAGGRRSALPGWLDDLGAAPCLDVVEDSGFTYYGRHFRSTDGSLPEQQGLTPLNEFGSVSLLTLPADNSTWSVVVVVAAGDAPLRGLSRTDRWTEAVRSMPGFEPWVDGEPLEDRVMAMAKIEDRIRSLVVDGRPVASGVLTVGDSWACTNPSVGRGVSIGMLHAVALRDTLHDRADRADADLSLEWDEVTGAVVGPWFEATRAGDRLRLAEMQALAAGAEFTSDDPGLGIGRALGAAAQVDADCARALFGIAGVLELPGDASAAPGVFDTVLEVGTDRPESARPGPSRAELVTLAAG